MTQLRSGEPWRPAPDYGRSLEGFTVNLLVANIDAALPFHTEVLGAAVVYSDPDIAVLRFESAEWLLHAFHTYDQHPLYATIRGDAQSECSTNSSAWPLRNPNGGLRPIPSSPAS